MAVSCICTIGFVRAVPALGMSGIFPGDIPGEDSWGIFPGNIPREYSLANILREYFKEI